MSSTEIALTWRQTASKTFADDVMLAVWLRVARRPASLVPPEYVDPARTPLEVDTANQPFELKVRKPKK